MTKARPQIIAHRGASGQLPEHTIESFRRAIELGADAIETDVVLTRDRQLVCRHDCELSITTDVATRPHFASRRSTRTIDEVASQGWFIEDFTLDEIRTLRARQRFDFRDRGFDDRFAIPTLAELFALSANHRTAAGQQPRVIVEIKHAAYHDSIGLPIDVAVAEVLRQFAYAGPDAPISVECFEIDVLKRVRELVGTPLIQLLDAAGARPADVVAAGGSLTYGQMITREGLSRIAGYASAIGAWKRLIVRRHEAPASAETRLAAPTTLIADAHAAGLEVHAWTFRDEARYLATDYAGQPAAEYRQFAALGLDGFITDFPDTALAALANP